MSHYRHLEAQPTTMPLQRWLEVNGAEVPAPEGEVRYPAVDELQALVRKAAGEA